VGDAGCGYDPGRGAAARALLEHQGSAPASGVGPLVRDHADALGAPDIAGHSHGSSAPAEIAALAPRVVALASAGDPAASEVVSRSVLGLLELAVSVADIRFPGGRPASFRAGVSGAILNHPFAFGVLSARSPFPLAAVTDAPIEGVRLLLARAAG